jgi:hypothetical protein
MAGTSFGVVVMGLSGLPAEQVRAMVEASRAAQGLPARVTDVRALARVVVLLGGPPVSPRAHAQGASTRAPAGGSEAPDGLDPAWVQGAGSVLAGSDRDMVHDSRDDCVLSAEVQRCPLAS